MSKKHLRLSKGFKRLKINKKSQAVLRLDFLTEA
jgi:hypothetical protein